MNLMEMTTAFPNFHGGKNMASLGLKHDNKVVEGSAAERKKLKNDRKIGKKVRKDKKADTDKSERKEKKAEKCDKKRNETKEIVAGKKEDMKIKNKKDYEEERSTRSKNKKQKTKVLKDEKNVVETRGMTNNQNGTTDKLKDTFKSDDKTHYEMPLNFDSGVEDINQEHMPELQRLLERLGRYRSKKVDDSLQKTPDEFHSEQQLIEKKQKLEEEREAEIEIRQLEELRRKLVEEEERRKADLLDLEEWKAKEIKILKRSREEYLTKLIWESTRNESSSLEKNTIELLKKDNAALQDQFLSLEQEIGKLTSTNCQLKAHYTKNDVAWAKIKSHLVVQSKYEYKITSLRAEVKTTRNAYLMKCTSCQAESAAKNIFQKAIFNILSTLEARYSNRDFVDSIRRFASKGGHKISQKRFNNVSQTCLESRKPSRSLSFGGIGSSTFSQRLGFGGYNERNNVARTRSFNPGMDNTMLSRTVSRSGSSGQHSRVSTRGVNRSKSATEFVPRKAAKGVNRTGSGRDLTEPKDLRRRTNNRTKSESEMLKAMRGSLEKRNCTLPSRLNKNAPRRNSHVNEKKGVSRFATKSSDDDYVINTLYDEESLSEFEFSTLSSDDEMAKLHALEQLDCSPVASSPTMVDNDGEARRALYLNKEACLECDMFLSDDSYESEVTDEDENNDSSYDDGMYIASLNPIVRRNEALLRGSECLLKTKLESISKSKFCPTAKGA